MNYFFQVSVRNIRESVPKALGFHFIKPLKNLRSHILFEIVRISQFDELLSEDPEISRKRKYFISLLSILKKSEKVMITDEE